MWKKSMDIKDLTVGSLIKWITLKIQEMKMANNENTMDNPQKCIAAFNIYLPFSYAAFLK